MSEQTRRIVGLFGPYRGRLAVVLALIVVSAGLAMGTPFLLRDVIDKALPQADTTLLSWLVGGMVAIAIAGGALTVVETYLSTIVGQRVMHDLREVVYRHLQRMSLAFLRTHARARCKRASRAISVASSRSSRRPRRRSSPT